MAHRYGVFICYEAVFADEVRQFARMGAQVLVNISDDGWYGDTSAPWQHLNMARMRAIENRRWLLRDTNNGVTASIDPYGRVLQSIPRHLSGCVAARFGFNSQITFYTAHGDVFAWLCAILALVDSMSGLAFAEVACGPTIKTKVRSQRAIMALNDLEFAYRSRARSGPRPAGVSLTLHGSAGNSPT